MRAGKADASEGDAGGASQYKEYDRSTCLQMVGRAGRPQFDTFGTAVIMTQREVRGAASTLRRLRCCAVGCGSSGFGLSAGLLVPVAVLFLSAACAWCRPTVPCVAVDLSHIVLCRFKHLRPLSPCSSSAVLCPPPALIHPLPPQSVLSCAHCTDRRALPEPAEGRRNCGQHLEGPLRRAHAG